jgi:hypothetical protein
MTLTRLPALRSGTHVALDDPTGDRLLELGATNVVRACDSLAIGPSRRNVLAHARAREEWFHAHETYDHLYSSEVRWETPIVVWVSAGLDDRPNLWRICSWLRDQGVPRGEVLILDLDPVPRRPGATPSPEPLEWIQSVRDHAAEVLLERLPTARPWPRERYDRAVRLWEQYVSPDPRRFAQRCLRGVPGFPELGPMWAFLARFFPRMTAARSLRLSRYDELLLSALSAEWQTPVKVYISDVMQEHWEFIGCVGDLTTEDRLAAWAKHGSSPAVERAPGPRNPESPMPSSVYRLTERGMQLRAGLPELADAPRLPVGGAEAYAPEAPWVLLDDGRLVRR